MTKTKLTEADVEWEEPTPARAGGGYTEQLCQTIAEMRAALSARRGSYAVVDTFDQPNKASSAANALNTRRNKGDSRLLHLEFAGRKMLDGGSKLYVRLAPAE